MFLLFLLFWIILNSRLTMEILVFGIAISAVMFLFICRFMGYSIKKEMMLGKSTLFLLRYLTVLLVEIVKANYAVVKLAFSPVYQPEPEIVIFKTHLKTSIARTLLANSITLTPGTVTVSVIGDEYTVHCFDKELAVGIEDNIFVKMLEKFEEGLV
ncbi:MAG: Na+/H+ antiporter subunit E [Spirochaetales bacterium]|nr:Na+/H+ antiporter subunit E [Candidatus Physcosoma equi]